MTLLDDAQPASAPAPPLAPPAAATRPDAARRDDARTLLRPRLPRTPLGLLVAIALLAGLVLRVLAPPALWLDEAQSVAIAQLPVPELLDALRQDGAPPLYYLLLHAWTAVAGESAAAVRAPSVLASLLTVPLVGLLAVRLAGLPALAPALVLASLSPFAVRYATETRMYSLMMLLSTVAGLALVAVLRGGGRWPRALLATATAGLVWTHYWALPLGAVAAVGLLVAWRRGVPAARTALVAVAVGGLTLLPWLPSLLLQTRRTAAPWGNPAGAEDVLGTAMDWMGVGVAISPTLGVALLVLVALGAAGSRDAGGVLALAPRLAPVGLRAAGAGSLVVLCLGVAMAGVGGQPVAVRYTAVVVAPVLVCAAAGAALLAPRVRLVVLLVLAVGGAAVGWHDGTARRTDADQVAAVLAQDAEPGDWLVVCPDQLGPALVRAVDEAGVAGLTVTSFPTLQPADRVDWTDYAERRRDPDTGLRAVGLDRLAGDGTLWVASARGYRVYRDSCGGLVRALDVLRPRGEGEGPLLPRGDVSPQGDAQTFDARTTLTRFPAGS